MTHLDQQLLEASKKGDFAKAFEALAEGANPNCRDETNYNWTPLHLCAREGDLRLGKALIARSADVNSKDRFGQTPLHRAAFWGNLKFVQFLIGEGADHTIADYTSQRPEELAFYQNHMNIYQYILQFKMDQKKKGELAKKSQIQMKQLQKELQRLDDTEGKLLKKESVLNLKIEGLTNDILSFKNRENWESDKRVKAKLEKLDKEVGKQVGKREKVVAQLNATRETRAEKKAGDKSTLSLNELGRSNSRGSQHRPSVTSLQHSKPAAWKNWD